MNENKTKKLFSEDIKVKDKIKRKKKRKRSVDDSLNSGIKGNYLGNYSSKGNKENLNYRGSRKKGAKDLSKRKSQIKKWEKEYNQIKSKKSFITREEYHEYYYKVRKANQKLSRLRNAKSFQKGKLSVRVDRFKNREDFDFYMNKIDNILDKDYYEKEMQDKREILKENLNEYFDSNDVFNELNELDDQELSEFFKDNFDLKPFIYSSSSSKDKLEHISISEDNILLRLHEFKNK